MLRIGLLGASRIAKGAVISPAADIDGCTVTRVAASDLSRAARYAEEHGIEDTEEDYAALVTSTDVDLVYNALPPSGHCEWTIAALEAGKDVLCEKPFAMNARQARDMVAAADRTGRTLVEAYHYRFHPLFDRVLELVRSGTIGSVESLHAHFNVPIRYRAEELRYRPELGGGAMMDLGCYPLHWVRSVVGTEPAVRSAQAVRHESGVDLSMSAELEFTGGIHATIRSAMGGDIPDSLDAALVIKGSDGELLVDNPLAPHLGHALRLRTRSAESVEEVGGQTTYHHQLTHVLSVLDGSDDAVTGGEDAIQTMLAIDAVYAAAGMPGPNAGGT